jgi:pimeloyl-ACP methyl ester carboxylesterase
MIPAGPDDPGAREMAETRAVLARWAPPTLVLWSDQDRVIRASAATVRRGETETACDSD